MENIPFGGFFLGFEAESGTPFRENSEKQINFCQFFRIIIQVLECRCGKFA